MRDFEAITVRRLNQFEALSYMGKVDDLIEQFLVKVKLDVLMDVPYIWQNIAKDFLQLWLLELEGTIIGIMATEIKAYLYGREMHHFMTSVYREHKIDWASILQYMEGVAKELECIRFSCSGRKGWTRLLEKHGYGTCTYSVCKDF